MRKLFYTPLTVFLLFFLDGYCQQPEMVVKSFEYFWQKNFDAEPQIVLASDDSIKRRIKNSFEGAIKKRWNIVLPDVLPELKKLPVLVMNPKFNTKLTNKEPGKWYLFLQIIDKGKIPNVYDGDGSYYIPLKLRCMILSGTNDSVIMDRTLTVNIYEEPAPSDQVQLKRLPAYPGSYYAAFDSIATWLFQSQVPNQKSIRLRTACVFQKAVSNELPLKHLSYKWEAENTYQTTDPRFSFRTPGTVYTKIGKKRNVGGNTALGALTLFTGIDSYKSRTFLYKADFPFEDGDSIFHCLIYYGEVESAERERVRNEDRSVSIKSEGYSFEGRNINPDSLNIITLGEDTIAIFSINFARESIAQQKYDKMWDGIDSTTIVNLPPAWNNTKKLETKVTISGKMNGYSFSMKTSREIRTKEFFINDQLMAVIYGMNHPVNGTIFHPLTTRQLKLFTILASIPYSYFN